MKTYSIILSILLLVVASFGAPVLLYGPDASIITEQKIQSAPPESLIGRKIPDNALVESRLERAFILLCDGQIIETSENTSLFFKSNPPRINVTEGVVTLFLAKPPDTLCMPINADSSRIRYASGDSILVTINDTVLWMARGSRYIAGDYRIVEGFWFDKPARDAKYLFKRIEKRELPAYKFDFDFPSARPKIFRHRSRGYAGIGTFEDERYYFAGAIYKMNLWKLEFAYDLWAAFSENGKFYGDAWDEWSDLLDHIRYLRLFRPGDPFYLRAGLVEDLTYGRGLLVDNYSNSIFLPFGKKNGLELRLRIKDFRAAAFVNDIGYPRVAGAHFRWKQSDILTVTATYAGDFDQFSNIEDSDGDSYPDETDPQPDIFNEPTDSAIIAANPERIDALGAKYLHGVAVGMD
ncbi:hypothetical protein DRQ36_10125, partial [bacterium]